VSSSEYFIPDRHTKPSLVRSEESDARPLVNVCDQMTTSISQTPHSSRYDRCSLLGLCLSTCRELLQGYQYLSNQLRSQFYGQVLPYTALAQQGRVWAICCVGSKVEMFQRGSAVLSLVIRVCLSSVVAQAIPSTFTCRTVLSQLQELKQRH
jgi:hypothetical protein